MDGRREVVLYYKKKEYKIMQIRLITVSLLVIFISACSTTEPLILHDSQGRVLKKTDKEAGKVTEWTYDAKGKISTTKSSKGITHHFYNPRDLLIKVERLPDNIVWEFDYTPDGKLKAIKDPAGNLIMYVYDQDGNLIKKILPDGTIELDPKSPLDPMGLASPKKSPELDKLGRTKSVDSNINKTSFSYNIHGRRSTIKKTDK
jgi:YD repeat-containing protein